MLYFLMTYSIDLRERACAYVRSGGSQSDASRVFGVTGRTLYNWLHRDDLTPKRHGSRRRKIDKRTLAAHVRDFPDALLRERAEHFNVNPSSIYRALKRLQITKKNDTLQAENSQ